MKGRGTRSRDAAPNSGGGRSWGLLGAALARSGAEVVLLLRPESLARYRGVIAVDSVVLGRFEAKIAGITVLDRDVDIVWITPKATDLQVALAFAPAAAVKAARTLDSPKPKKRRRVARSGAQTHPRKRLESPFAGVRTVTPGDGMQVWRRSLHKVTRSNDQEDVMSNMRNTPRPTASALERLVAHRRAARMQRELDAVLAGLHGQGVRSDVLAAMDR